MSDIHATIEIQPGDGGDEGTNGLWTVRSVHLEILRNIMGDPDTRPSVMRVFLEETGGTDRGGVVPSEWERVGISVEKARKIASQLRVLAWDNKAGEPPLGRIHVDRFYGCLSDMEQQSELSALAVLAAIFEHLARVTDADARIFFRGKAQKA